MPDSSDRLRSTRDLFTWWRRILNAEPRLEPPGIHQAESDWAIRSRTSSKFEYECQRPTGVADVHVHAVDRNVSEPHAAS